MVRKKQTKQYRVQYQNTTESICYIIKPSGVHVAYILSRVLYRCRKTCERGRAECENADQLSSLVVVLSAGGGGVSERDGRPTEAEQSAT